MRILRRQRNWSQEKLAAKLQLFGWDISRESVSKLENHQRRVPDLELFILSKVLGTGMEELFARNLRSKIRTLAPQYRPKLSRGQLPP